MYLKVINCYEKCTLQNKLLWKVYQNRILIMQYEICKPPLGIWFWNRLSYQHILVHYFLSPWWTGVPGATPWPTAKNEPESWTSVVSLPNCSVKLQVASGYQNIFNAIKWISAASVPGLSEYDSTLFCPTKTVIQKLFEAIARNLKVFFLDRMNEDIMLRTVVCTCAPLFLADVSFSPLRSHGMAHLARK